jgi:leucyl/phenylalanyl-tRNA--protein transferase
MVAASAHGAKDGNVHAPRALPLIEPELLMLAYRSGIFPMADSRDDPEVFWIEPRLRAILPLDSFHLSRSLARTLRRGRFTVTCNRAFSRVMEECAAPRRASCDEDEPGSWISHRIQASYENLHFLGHAHSIEVWQDIPNAEPALVGGLYGVGFDRVFCGESMFSRVPDSSKVAMAWLVAALRRAGVMLLDCQFITPHLASLGAAEITQKRYVRLLQAAQSPYATTPYSPVGVAGAIEGAADAAALPDGEGGLDGVGAGDVLALPEAFGAVLDDVAAAGLSSSPGYFIAQALTQTS